MSETIAAPAITPSGMYLPRKTNPPEASAVSFPPPRAAASPDEPGIPAGPIVPRTGKNATATSLEISEPADAGGAASADDPAGEANAAKTAATTATTLAR